MEEYISLLKQDLLLEAVSGQNAGQEELIAGVD